MNCTLIAMCAHLYILPMWVCESVYCLMRVHTRWHRHRSVTATVVEGWLLCTMETIRYSRFSGSERQ